MDTEHITETETSPEGQQNENGGMKKKILSAIWDILDIAESVCTSVFVVLLVFAFLLRPVTVDGSSMNPTLYHEDELLMTELFYTPKTGDVVIIDGAHAHVFADGQSGEVIEKPGMGIRLVKRVIALAGQTVDIDFSAGIVKVDGMQLHEDYIAALTTRNDAAFTYPLTIPEGYIFVMGDNRNNSSDSRNPDVGLVSEDDVLGHVIFRIGRNEEHRNTWAEQFAIVK